MASGDHFSAAGDPNLPREIRARREREEQRQRVDTAVKELRQAVSCLLLMVPESVVHDVRAKAEVVIAELLRASR